MEAVSTALPSDDGPRDSSPPFEPTDAQLLGAYVESRDAGAFESLLRRHGPMVLATCRRVLRNEHDADDAFQATFLVLARKAQSIAPREMFANWLYGVAYRTSLKVRTLARKRGAREHNIDHVSNMPEPAMQEREPLWQDVLVLLDLELNKLPDKYRLPIVLCDLEGQTHEAAARQLGWPQGTLAGRLWRARKKLADRLTRRGLTIAVGSLGVLLARHETLAELQPALFDSTAKVAGLVATDTIADSALLPHEIAMIAQGVMRTMFVTKLRVGAMWTSACVTAVMGVAGWNLLTAAPGADADVRTAQSVSGEDVKTKALDELQGDWLCVAAERKGDEIPTEEVKASKLVFSIKGGEAALGRAAAANKVEGKIRIDPSASPKELDLVDFSVANGSKKTAAGIYELNGNTLKFCYGTRRPTEFKTSQDASLDERLYVFERQKKMD